MAIDDYLYKNNRTKESMYAVVLNYTNGDQYLGISILDNRTMMTYQFADKDQVDDFIKEVQEAREQIK